MDVTYPFIRTLKEAAVSPQWRDTGVDKVDLGPLIQLLQMQLDQGPESALWERTRPMPDLLEVAYETRHRHAKDPRDRLYALISMINQRNKKSFTPDYHLSIEEVYSKFGKQFKHDAGLALKDAIFRDTEPISENGTTEGQTGDQKRPIDIGAETAAPNADAGLIRDEPCSSSSPDSQQPVLGLQLQTLLDDLEDTHKQTNQLVSAGKLGRAAELLARVAKDLEHYTDTQETA